MGWINTPQGWRQLVPSLKVGCYDCPSPFVRQAKRVSHLHPSRIYAKQPYIPNEAHWNDQGRYIGPLDHPPGYGHNSMNHDHVQAERQARATLNTIRKFKIYRVM